METLPNFYNNLLGIEVTTFGVLTAAAFVFLQMMHTNFSFRDMFLSLRNRTLPFYALLSGLLVLFTGLGSLHFAIGAHDFIPQVNLNSREVFENGYVAAVLLLGFFYTAALGMVIVLGNIRLLNPAELLRRHLEFADASSVEKYLHSRFGVPSPLPLVRIRFFSTKGEEKTDEEEEAEWREKEAQYERDTAKSETLKEAAKDAPDVFEAFDSLLIKAIAGGDTGSVKNGLENWTRKIIEIIGSGTDSFPGEHMGRHVAESLREFLEACRKHNSQSLAPYFIRATQRIALELMGTKHADATLEIMKTWKAQADIAIQESDRALFRDILQGYQEVGDLALKRDKEAPKERNEVREECFRHLGWLAERLLTKKGLEERPIMYDTDYYDEYGTLHNTLFHFSHKYNYDYPDLYPLIFFDAIHVLFNKMLDVYTQNAAPEKASIRGEAKVRLFDCAYVYASFAQKAIAAGNADGVALAAVNLKQIHRSALEAGAEDAAQDSIQLIVRLAIECAANPEKVAGSEILRLPQGLEDIILNSTFTAEIRSEVFESYLPGKIEGDYKKKWAYIKELGTKMGTNFGLNFDSQ